MAGYALAGLLVFGVNLLPAFGPPTWAVLVLLKLHLGLAAVPLIIVGALAAASGRYVLAWLSQKVGGRVFTRYEASLDAARERLLAHRGATVAGLGLFALSPVPSGQLFVAAGLLDLPLLAVTAAFFAGRVVSYAGYVTAATIADRSYGDVATSALRSPWAIAVQVLLLGALAVAPILIGRSGLKRQAAP